jgi:hypothetical protein
MEFVIRAKAAISAIAIIKVEYLSGMLLKKIEAKSYSEKVSESVSLCLRTRQVRVRVAHSRRDSFSATLLTTRELIILRLRQKMSQPCLVWHLPAFYLTRSV